MRSRKTFKRDHAEQRKYQLYQGIICVIRFIIIIIHNVQFNSFTGSVPVCVKAVFVVKLPAFRGLPALFVSECAFIRDSVDAGFDP